MATWYPILRSVHVTTAVISLVLFVLRGIWMMRSPERLGAQWVRVIPHVNDAILLTAAVGLALVVGQYPFVHGWLTAKLIALLLYIALGMVALKRGRTLGTRATAWVAALFVYGYIVAVASTRNPAPWAT
jgi:uncharacterized membrane protein SirB2